MRASGHLERRHRVWLSRGTVGSGGGAPFVVGWEAEIDDGVH